MPLTAITRQAAPEHVFACESVLQMGGIRGAGGCGHELSSAAPLLLSGLCREAHFDSEPQHRPRREMKESQDVGARGQCAQGQTERARHDAVVGRGSSTGRNARRQTGPRAPSIIQRP